MVEVRTSTARETYGVERVAALSDGVFAIVLTLLVLELKLPELHGTDPVLTVLANDAHDLAAWGISFVAVARFWVVHHSVTSHLRRCEVGTVAINLVVLAAMSLVPFSTSAIGSTDLGDPWGIVLFAGNLAVASVSTGWLARHAATNAHLRDPDRSVGRLSWHHRHHVYVLPAITVVAAALGFAEPYAAVGLLAVEFSWVAVTGLRRHL